MNSKKKENDGKNECGLCDETFSVKKNLGSHIATHKKPNGQNTKQNSAKVTNGEIPKKPKKAYDTNMTEGLQSKSPRTMCYKNKC